MLYDVIVIGAGITGAAVARELSRYELSICVLEKGEDVCSGTTKANSAIIHAGYDALPGSMKAKMNVEGNRMFDELSKTLDFPFRRNGSFVVCLDENEKDGIRSLYDRGIKNGVTDMEILDGEGARALEKNLSEKTVSVLYAKTAGIVCPFKMNIAYAENAYENGADFFFNTEVEKISKNNDGTWLLSTNNGTYKTRLVVNAAGVYADKFHNMVSEKKLHITPRRGEYNLLDKTAGGIVDRTIFQLPTKKGKGVLVAPTVHGNVIVGPTSVETPDHEETRTTQEGIDFLTEKAVSCVPTLPMRQVITGFAGLRAHEDGGDFILGPADPEETFFDCAGIESPGLSSAPAIGVLVSGMIKDRLKAKEKASFKPERKDILNPANLSIEERNKLIKENPAYGRIICRCESVTEGEIIDAIRRPLGARSLDGIKRRTRAGMGRCQAGFCSPRVMEIICRETGLSLTDITKSGGDSKIVICRTKGVRED